MKLDSKVATVEIKVNGLENGHYIGLLNPTQNKLAYKKFTIIK